MSGSDAPIRIRKSTGYRSFSALGNDTVRNPDLPYDALGLLLVLAGRPDDWMVRPSQLRRAGSGRDAVYRLLNVLIKAGYVKRYDQKKINGHWGPVEYEVFDTPQLPPDTTQDSVPTENPPYPENPYTETQDTILRKTPTKKESISSEVSEDITPAPPAQPPLIETPAAPPKTPKPRKPRATAPANPDRSKIYNAIGMLYYGVDPVKDPAAFKPFGAMTNKLTTTFLKAHPFTYDEFIECSKTFPQGYRDWLKAETNIGETVGKWLKEKQRQAAITARASMVIRARNPLNDTITHYRDGKPIFVEIDGKVIPCNERGEPLKETSI